MDHATLTTHNQTCLGSAAHRALPSLIREVRLDVLGGGLATLHAPPIDLLERQLELPLLRRIVNRLLGDSLSDITPSQMDAA